MTLIEIRTNTKRNVPRNLELLRRLSGQTHKQLAAELGCSTTTIHNRLNGKADIPVQEVATLAAHFEVPVEALFLPPTDFFKVLADLDVSPFSCSDMFAAQMFLPMAS